MRVKSALALISVAVAFGLAGQSSAEAGWCRRGAPPGWCGPEPVSHYVYYPYYRNSYYYMTTFAPYDPYPSVYVPRGYWPRYDRPFWRFGRRFWWPRRARYYAVPAPMPVPVGCCAGPLK
jgi:hypothetical protein